MKKKYATTTGALLSSKIIASPRALAALDDGATLAAIIRVRVPGHVPEGVTIRAQISPTLFTADVAGGALASLEADPEVISVALPRRI